MNKSIFLSLFLLTLFSFSAVSQSIIVKDGNYNIVGRIDGNIIKDGNYNIVGRIDGNIIKDSNYNIVARITGSPRSKQLISILYFVVL